MTTGYVWKLISAGFLSSWRLFLISVIVGGVCGVISGMFFDAHTLGFRLVLFILILPIVAYVSPLVAALGVTVLSNYYQWAINNPRNVP
ncbi:MAG: hypothetical protein DYH13_04480 [Alphaproteobacteria bacterium PRO2]|nr:hypothetical protein [Alphaproteobacteria bacterium PRO2]